MMRKRHSTIAWIGLAVIAMAGVWTMTDRGTIAAEPRTVLRHVVMYKFKADQSPAAVQEVIDTFSGLPKKIDTIIGYEHGTNTSEEGKSDGLTHVFVVTFRDKAGLATYLKHPAHDAYVQVVKDRREKVVVFDYLAAAP